MLLAGAVGCKKIQQLLTFTVKHSQTIQIPAIPASTQGTLVTLPPVTVDNSKTYGDNNTRADLVKDVSLHKLSLSISSPSGQNFDFLQRIELYIGSDQSEQVRLAYLDEVPRGVSSIELLSTNTKLDQYLKGASYTITTKVQTRQPVSQALTVRADMQFKVTADPF
ncbi:hypothetical protein GCM10023185_03440 [Hymenobacter saemangeumensis]|uniref:Lipoprotein n=1 Tax=Hymenobacter saemangeumensis TaxID=1084522 RepID=A0ABP8HZ91_9BACT